jgi:hypothetical protein
VKNIHERFALAVGFYTVIGWIAANVISGLIVGGNKPFAEAVLRTSAQLAFAWTFVVCIILAGGRSVNRREAIPLLLLPLVVTAILPSANHVALLSVAAYWHHYPGWPSVMLILGAVVWGMMPPLFLYALQARFRVRSGGG